MPPYNPFSNLDPFSDINRQLRSVGIAPLKMGPLQFPDMSQRQDEIQRDLALQQQRMEGMREVNPVLSGLEWTGRKLDALTGLRGIKGLLTGKPREALSAIPILGTFGDE